jgi:hypothetical protein
VILVVCVEGSYRWIPGIILKPLDQKARAFLVLIVFLWWFFGHVHKLFGEISMRH